MSSSGTNPIPLGALRQVAYCPRLYYLAEVEQAGPRTATTRALNPEADTRRLHQISAGAEGPSQTRWLTSVALGIAGWVSVVELPGGRLRPVLARDAKPPRGDNGAPGIYEYDAIALCAQALLLEEATGTPVPFGYLDDRRSGTCIEVPLDGSLRARTFETILQVREIQTFTRPPALLPMVLRHRCHGCVVREICQPEPRLGSCPGTLDGCGNARPG